MRRAIRLSGPHSVRFWLVLPAVVCVLPAVLIAILLVDRSYHQERANLERDTVATARALGQAVDAEIVGIQTVLQMLASSPQLQSGNLAEFYEQAQTAMRLTRGNNMLLISPEVQLRRARGACDQAPGERRAYGLYQNSARNQPWGNTIGTNTESSTGTGSGQALTVYGRVGSQSTPSPGSYSDSVVVTVTY